MGAKLGKLVKAGQIIALLGDLCAGKTRPAQGFGAGLGVPADEVINSPTFTLINEYQGRLPFYHVDLYRLSKAVEAETLGLDDYFYGEGVTLIEWANRLGNSLPPERLEIELHHLSETKRRITIRACGPEHTELLKQFKKSAFGV